MRDFPRIRPMKHGRFNPFEVYSAAAAWMLIGGTICLLFFGFRKIRPDTAASAEPAPGSQIALEHFPLHDIISVEAPSAAASEPQHMPDPKPEEKPEAEPPPEEKPQKKAEAVRDVTPVPEPVPETKPDPPREPEPENESVAELQAVSPPVISPPAESDAAAQRASTVLQGGEAVSPSLLQQLRRMVERAKYYPARARRTGITGKAVLRLTISCSGEITNVSVVSAGHAVLASGAQKAGDRLTGRTVSPPPCRTLTVNIPIIYELR